MKSTYCWQLDLRTLQWSLYFLDECFFPTGKKYFPNREIYISQVGHISIYYEGFSPFARARIYNYVYIPVPVRVLPEKYVLQHPCQSTSYKIVSENLRKSVRYIWSEWIYPLLLHPLSKRRKALKLTFWQKRSKNSDSFLPFCPSFNQESGIGKEKRKKTSENIWKLCYKVLTFAPAFQTEAIENLTCWLRNGFVKNFTFLFLLPPFR